MYALWGLINFSGFIILEIFYNDNVCRMIYLGTLLFTLHNLMEPEDLNYDKVVNNFSLMECSLGI